MFITAVCFMFLIVGNSSLARVFLQLFVPYQSKQAGVFSFMKGKYVSKNSPLYISFSRRDVYPRQLTVVNLEIYHNKWHVVKRQATILP